jgi:hypothetical protein
MVRPVGGNAYTQPSDIQTQSTNATNDKSVTQPPNTTEEPPIGSFAKAPQPLREKAELEADSKKRSDDLQKELQRYADKTPKKSQEVKIEEPPDYTFKDVDKLKSPNTRLDREYNKQTVGAMLKADLAGTPKGLFTKNYDSASPQQKEEMARALQGALADDKNLNKFIQEKPERLARTNEIVDKVLPDPSIKANEKTRAAIKNFKEWDKYNDPPKKYPLIVVPGYTPLGQEDPLKLHPTAEERCKMAADEYKKGRAPFIMVSGGNVHPSDTQFNEAIEMKAKLKEMGVPEDRIIVEGKARHSTTNLRNAGRFMLEDGHKDKFKSALVLTDGGQAFYFGEHALTFGAFHGRSQAELGYTVGRLNGSLRENGNLEVDFRPSQDVKRKNTSDILDP